MADRSLAVKSVAATFVSIAFVVVCFRVYCRSRVVKSFGWDDGLIVVAMVNFIHYPHDNCRPNRGSFSISCTREA